MNTEGSITLPDGSTIKAGHAAALHISTDSYPINIIGWSRNGRTVHFLSGRDYARGRTVSKFGKSLIRHATWRRPGTRQNPDEGCFQERGCAYTLITLNGHQDHRSPEF